MSDGPKFADMPPELTAIAWKPVRRGNKVWIGLSPRQRWAWFALCSAVGLFVASVALFLDNVPLIILTLVTIGALMARPLRVGIELGPSSFTVRSWGPRGRTVEWSSVESLEASPHGTLKLNLAGGHALVLPAPRKRWVVVDEDFEAKVGFIQIWRVERRSLAPDAGARPGFTGLTWRGVGRRGAPAAAKEGHPAAGAPTATREAPFAPESPFPVTTLASLFFAAIIVGYLFVGKDVLVLAIALLVLLRFGRDPGRPLALAAFLLLVIAALASLFQDPSGQVNMAYSVRRTIAAEAGAIVGVFLVLATIIFSVTERAPDAAPAQRGLNRILKTDTADVVRAVRARVAVLWPFAGIGFVALVLRIAGAPGALPPAYNPLLDNLRIGSGYSLAAPSGGVPNGTYPPLAASIAAYFPLGPKVALLGVSVATVLLVARCGFRYGGRATALLASALAAVMPSLWAQQLPIQTASLLVVGAVVLADPKALTSHRGGLAGACLGLAVLARPDTAFAAIVIVAWLLIVGGRTARGAVAWLVVWLAIFVSPWLNYVWSEFGLPWPMADLASSFNDPSTVSRLPAVVGFVVGMVVAVGFALAVKAMRGSHRVVLPYVAIPLVAVALSLTDLPRRDPLGWAAPIVAVVIGSWLAQVAEQRGVLSSVLEGPYADLDLWRRAQRRAPAEEILIDPEPEEERLFM